MNYLVTCQLLIFSSCLDRVLRSRAFKAKQAGVSPSRHISNIFKNQQYLGDGLDKLKGRI